MSTARLCTLALFALILFGCGSLIPNAPYDEPKSRLRIATYNVNWGNGDWEMKDPESTIAVIAALKADVVVLQETTPHWQRLCLRHLRKAFPYQQFRHYENAGGLAFLSKYPVRSVRYGKPSYGWHPYWIAKVNTRLGAVTIVNTHLTPSLNKNNGIGFMGSQVFSNAKVRYREIKDIFAAIKTKKRLIIAGDFNEGDRSNSLQYLKRQGLHDATEQYSWPTWHWRAGPFLLQNRYDRIFYSSDLTAVKAQSLQAGGSDHFPVIVDFK